MSSIFHLFSFCQSFNFFSSSYFLFQQCFFFLFTQNSYFHVHELNLQLKLVLFLFQFSSCNFHVQNHKKLNQINPAIPLCKEIHLFNQTEDIKQNIVFNVFRHWHCKEHNEISKIFRLIFCAFYLLKYKKKMNFIMEHGVAVQLKIYYLIFRKIFFLSSFCGYELLFNFPYSDTHTGFQRCFFFHHLLLQLYICGLNLFNVSQFLYNFFIFLNFVDRKIVFAHERISSADKIKIDFECLIVTLTIFFHILYFRFQASQKEANYTH